MLECLAVFSIQVNLGTRRLIQDERTCDLNRRACGIRANLFGKGDIPSPLKRRNSRAEGGSVGAGLESLGQLARFLW